MKWDNTFVRRPCCAILLIATSLIVGYPAAASQLLAQQLTSESTTKAISAALAFEGVTVIDVVSGNLLKNYTVVIAGNRVQRIGPASEVQLPQRTMVVDARGKYLIPGLWDMHMHLSTTHRLPANVDQIYQRFIAHGVTGVREMAQRYRGGTDSFYVWQREFAAGARVGPRMVGPSVDLSQGNGIQIATREDASRVMDSLKAINLAFVKFHANSMGRNLFFAIAREARRVGLPLVGHVPSDVTSVEAADSGMRSVEHAYETHQCWPPPDSAAPGRWKWWGKPIGDTVALEKRCAPVVKAYSRNDTWVTPTMAFKFFKDHEFAGVPPERRPSGSSLLDYQKFVRVLHRLGFQKLLSGTDTPGHGAPPGFASLQELVFFVEAGLTPLEALRTATLNPAKYLNATDSLGSIAAGKLADLVLLDADPLADIYNTMKIRAVIANGRYFDRAALDAMDPEGVQREKDFVEQRRNSAKTASTSP